MTLESPTNPPTPPAPQSHENASDKATHPQRERPPINTPEMHPKPPHPHYEITCKKKRDWWDRAKMGAEFAGIVFLVIYTLYTAGIYHANRKAAKAAKSAADTAAKTMMIDQRAWVSPHIINQIFAKDKPLVVPIQFDNTGKTPAIHVQTCVVAEPVDHDFVPICPESSKSPGFDVIFPQGHIARLPNATGSQGTTLIDPEGLLREPLMKELQKRKKTVLVFGRVDYLDVFKKPHWSTFCSTMLIIPQSGSMPQVINWSTCPKWNDIDTEDENTK
jgi:hypothetical protein